MELTREEPQDIKSKTAQRLLNRYGPSILDNSITDDQLQFLHVSFQKNSADGKQFVDGLWPYLNERQRFVLMQRLIPLDVEGCVERNALFRSKTLLLLLLLAEARTQNFAAEYANYLDQSQTEQEFFDLLIADPLPQLLACVFQSVFQLIIKQKAEPVLEASLGRKLDQATEMVLQKINGAKSPNEVYKLIDNVGLAELWIFNIIKAIMTEKINASSDTADLLLKMAKLNGWLNRKNASYVAFCEQYYQKMCAVSDQLAFENKTRAQIDIDRRALMENTQAVSFPALISSRFRITADATFARMKEKADARKQQREPLVAIDANEENLAEQKTCLTDVLDAYVQEVSTRPTAAEILEHLVYLKLTLQSIMRRSGGKHVDAEMITAFQQTLGKILEVVDVNILHGEDQAAISKITSEIRVLLDVDETLENVIGPE